MKNKYYYEFERVNAYCYPDKNAPANHRAYYSGRAKRFSRKNRVKPSCEKKIINKITIKKAWSNHAFLCLSC